MTLLVARNLAVSARLADGIVPVVRDLDFTLEPGKVLGIVGESGAGKTMLGRTIAQLLPPGFSVSGGSLLFAGEDLVRMDSDRRRGLLGREIAFVPQEPLSALNPVLTVGRQFDEHLARLGIESRGRRREKALSMFEAVRLPHGEDLLRKYPHQLSGGMCQRVLIAIAFSSRPRLVVADEPTTALDVTTQARIVQLIAEMQERDGTGLVFITHDLRLAAQICDDILVLYAGRPAEVGPARKLFSAPAHPYTRCLQLSIPNISGPRRGLYALPERMPGLLAVSQFTGCRFAPRCPLAIAECAQQEPAVAEHGTGHRAACIRTRHTSGIAAPLERPDPGDRVGEPLVEVSDLSKRFATRRSLFGRSREFTAVRDVRFDLGANEFVGIVGESGSGKSTLAKLIVGLERPSEGRIVIAGRDVTEDRAEGRAHRRRVVQMVFQDPQSALNPRRRVASIVTQPLEAAGQATDEERAVRAEQLLTEIGLAPELGMRYPAQLSGGQRQRVNIARALCARPKVLVADEIVSGLDVSVQAQLLDLLLRLRREFGFSMLFISHDLAVVRHLCSRVLVMYRGEVVESGPTERVFSEPRHPYTRMLLAAVPPDDPHAVWKPLSSEPEPASTMAAV